MRSSSLAPALVLACLAACQRAPVDTLSAERPVPLAVPAGITLVPLGEKSRIAPKAAAITGDEDKKPGAAFAVRLGSADGAPLYFSDKPEACDAECLKKFPPFTAPASAAAPGSATGGAWDFKDAGSRQWVFRSHALHTHVLVDGDQTPLPPEWHLARFDPAEGAMVPPGIEVREARTAGAVLTDTHGLTMYRLRESLEEFAKHCDLRCQQDWLPVTAPALAVADGSDFSVVARPDGTRQWAHRGQPLFTYRGDALPGETAALDSPGGAARWQVAEVLAYPNPAGAVSRDDAEQGPIWLTRNGDPLYTRHRYDANDFGGKNFRGTFHQPYGVGKDIGVNGCDAACQQQWPPFLAAADAEASGYWQIFTRDDGRRQWAYKGYALYTYAGDTRGGAVTGTNLYTLDRGDEGRYKVSELTTLGDRTLFREGAFFWHVAIPDL